MAGAAKLCERELAHYPHDANLLCLAARACLALRRFDEARAYVDTAIQQHPGFAVAHDVLGDLLLVEGQSEDAIAAYQQALKLDPSHHVLLQKIAKANELLQRQGEATTHTPESDRSPRRQMAFADQIRKAGNFEKSGDGDKAEAIYRKILRTDPDHVEASRLLARIAVAHEQFGEAAVFLRRATILAPDYTRAWVDLANALRQLEEYDEAIDSAAKVIELAPDNAESYMVYGSVAGAAGRHEEAIKVYERAIELAPEKSGAMCSMAHHLKTIGRQDEAIAQYRASIAARHDHCEAYWSLANLKTFRFSSAEIDAMHKLLADDSLSDESRAQLHNALGLEYEAQKDFAKAFENFEQCNHVRRKTESYDPVETETTHDRVIELFDARFFEQPAGDTLEPTPIFVVGLPRSGSTLIEQILASHSMVEGTHELSDLSKVVRAMRQRARRDKRFPEIIAGLKETGWSKIGAQYMERTQKHRSGAPFFIDKNPNNFIFIGMLKLAIPNAKIINARRHPLDSCLGSFKQLFASGQPFSYDEVELAEYYLQYQRLMDHWHRVLPGFVLDVHYEEVVSDLDTQTKRLLDFCGLPFEDQCLRFYETERAIKTASSEQVRRPIYSTSINLWRNYEKHLETMIHIMNSLFEGLPENDRPNQT